MVKEIMVYPINGILCTQQKGNEELLPTWESGYYVKWKRSLKKEPTISSMISLYSFFKLINLLALPCFLKDPSSPVRDPACTPALGVQT